MCCTDDIAASKEFLEVLTKTPGPNISEENSRLNTKMSLLHFWMTAHFEITLSMFPLKTHHFLEKKSSPLSFYVFFQINLEVIK